MGEFYSIFYFPLDYGIVIAKDKNIPVADKILSVYREGVIEVDDSIAIDFTIYRYDRIFIVKHEIDFLCSIKKTYKEDLFLTVLRSNHDHEVIIDWIDLTRESVFILPSYFLNEYLENLIERYHIDENKEKWFLSLPQENLEKKEKRRFGCEFSYLREIFQKELQELEESLKKER
jgi:hypothetical protein